jgi:hypothetical protein
LRENKRKRKSFLKLQFSLLFYVSLALYHSLDSPGIGNQITASEKRNPNWHRHKAHFTSQGTTSATCPTTFCGKFSVHHYSNVDPTSDLNHHPNMQTYHNSINPIIKANMTPAFQGSLHNPRTWAIFHTQTKRSQWLVYRAA